MALKQYSKHTLNGDWFEERSAPLNGVIADYKGKHFDTTTGSTFTRPDRVVPKPKVSGMINREQFFFGKVNDRSISNETFGVEHAQKINDTFYNQTSYSTDFGVANRERFLYNSPFRSRMEDQVKIAAKRPPAGGHPSVPPPRSMCTSGAIGETHKESDEPQYSTPAQRAWLYGLAPELQFRSKSGDESKGDEGVPAPAEEKSQDAKKYHPRAITFGLTAQHYDLYRVNRKVVFQDDM